MKFWIVMMMLVTSAFAQDERVIRELKRREIEYTLRIEEATFEHNINGYGCAWPGLRAPFVFDYYAELKHGRNFFDRNVLALKEGELDHEFCDWFEAVDVFGPQFILGKEIKMKILVVKELIEIENSKYLKETVSSHVLGRNLESKSYLPLAH